MLRVGGREEDVGGRTRASSAASRVVPARSKSNMIMSHRMSRRVASLAPKVFFFGRSANFKFSRRLLLLGLLRALEAAVLQVALVPGTDDTGVTNGGVEEPLGEGLLLALVDGGSRGGGSRGSAIWFAFRRLLFCSTQEKQHQRRAQRRCDETVRATVCDWRR